MVIEFTDGQAMLVLVLNILQALGIAAVAFRQFLERR